MNGKIATVAIGIVVALLLALAAAPALVGWDGHKGEIAGRLGEVLGRRVEIVGPLTVRLLPTPRATAEGVAVFDADGGVAAEATAVRLGLKWSALLGGKLAFDGVTVEGGRVGRMAVDGIGARIALPEDGGPLVGKGSARWRGLAVDVEASVGRLSVDRLTPVSVALRLPEAAARLDLSGTVAGSDFSGKLTAAADDPQRLSAALGGAAVPGRLAAEATVSAGPTEAALTNLVLTLGTTRAAGSVVAALQGTPRVDVMLSASAVDLDGWTRAPPRPVAAVAAPPSPPPQSVAPPSAAPPVAKAFALPKGLFVNAVLGVESLSWQGREARAIRLEATLDEGELVLERAQALLPGGTQLLADGTLAARDGKPLFEGRVQAASENFHTLLGWAGIDPARLPADRLNRFGLVAAIVADDAELGFRDLRLTVDSTRASGEGAVALAGPRSGRLALEVDSLDLDAYLPPVAAPAVPAAPAAPAAPAVASAPTSPPPPAAAAGLPEIDAHLDLGVKRLVVRHIAAEEVKLSAALSGGALRMRATVRGFAQGGDTPPSLQRLGAVALDLTASGDPRQRLVLRAAAETGALRLSANGEVADFPARPRFTFDLGAQADSLTPVLRMFAQNAQPIARSGGVAVTGRLSGDSRVVQLADLDARVGTLHLTGGGQANLAGARPAITGRLVGDVIDLDFPLAATSPTPAAAAASSAKKAPSPPPTVPAAASAPWSNQPLDLSALKAVDARLELKAEAVVWHGWRFDNPAASLTLDNGIASLDRLTAKALGGDLAAEGRLTGGSLPQLSGNLTVAGADLGKAGLGSGRLQLTRGVAGLAAKFAAAGRSTAEMVSRLSGDGRFDVKNGRLEGFDLPAVNAQLRDLKNIGSLLGLAQAGLSGGETRFSVLTGTFRAENGVVVTRDTRLDADGGNATAEATIDLGRWTVDSRIAIRVDQGSAPPLVLRFDGPLDNPSKVIDINELQRALVSRGLGEALKGKGGGGIGGFLGGLLGGKR